MTVECEDMSSLSTLKAVRDSTEVYRFVSTYGMLLFYPAEKTTDKHIYFNDAMPFILSLQKHGGFVKGQYTGYIFNPIQVTDEGVYLLHSKDDYSTSIQFCSYKGLYEDYVFIDGSAIVSPSEEV